MGKIAVSEYASPPWPNSENIRAFSPDSQLRFSQTRKVPGRFETTGYGGHPEAIVRMGALQPESPYAMNHLSLTFDGNLISTTTCGRPNESHSNRGPRTYTVPDSDR